jgi:hypothetical protein
MQSAHTGSVSSKGAASHTAPETGASVRISRSPRREGQFNNPHVLIRGEANAVGDEL